MTNATGQKRLVGILTVLAAVLTAVGAQWHYLCGGRLNGISSVGSHVWVAGQDGMFLQSYDNGVSWRRVPRFTARNLMDVEFRDYGLGIVIAEGDMVYRTTNAGASWDSSHVEYSEGRARFLTNNQVMIDGRDRLLWSTDAGENWHDRGAAYGACWFVDTVLGWSGSPQGYFRHVYRSTDGGWTWAVRGTIPNPECWEFHTFGFADSLRGVCNYLVSVQHPRIPSYCQWAITDDGGLSWDAVRGSRWAQTCDVTPEGRILGVQDYGCWVFEVGNRFLASPEPSVRLRDAAAAKGERTWLCGDGGFIWHTTDSGRSWGVAHPGSGGSLRSVAFVDSLRGWAASEHAVLKTTDGGRRWLSDDSLCSRVDGGFTGLSIVCMDTLFAVEESIVWWIDFFPVWSGAVSIHRSTDRGSSWSLVHRSDGQSGAAWGSSRLCFLDGRHGWHAGNRSGINSVRTTDRGSTWLPMPALPGNLAHAPPYGYSFLDTLHGWMVNAEGGVWQTTNGGDSWAEIHHDTVPITDIHMFDENDGWATSDAGPLKTTDGGSNWELVPAGHRLEALHFVDSRHGVAVGEHGLILRTTNSGSDWHVDTCEFTSCLLDVFMLDSTRAWAVGENGLVLGFGDWALGAEAEGQPARVPELLVWPNPCQRRLNLVSGLPPPVSVQVLDIAGRVVMEGLPRPERGGLQLDVSRLPAGVYFVSVAAKGFRSPVRFIKVE